MNESAIRVGYRENDTDYMTKHTIMESVKIDYLVEKYFQGNQYCRRITYFFSSSDVAFRTIQAYF
jgi:hypothetical protein